MPSADTSALKLVKIKAGSELNISVPIAGNPTPQVEWSYRDSILQGKALIKFKNAVVIIRFKNFYFTVCAFEVPTVYS